MTFGDHDPADTFDTAAPDPEQVAARLHRIRRDLQHLAGLRPDPEWWELARVDRDLAVAVIVLLLEWLHRSGP